MADLDGANSTEFNRNTEYPVIALISEWTAEDGTVEKRDEQSDMGGTMRLGAQLCGLKPASRAHDIYDAESIYERHRHRYEFNNNYLELLESKGLVFSGFSQDGLVEMIELADHPWFVATQFHPEFTSSPRDGHPLFTDYIATARELKEAKE